MITFVLRTLRTHYIVMLYNSSEVIFIVIFVVCCVLQLIFGGFPIYISLSSACQMYCAPSYGWLGIYIYSSRGCVPYAP